MPLPRMRVRRFGAALDAIKGADEMWVQLARCNVHDAKIKKVPATFAQQAMRSRADTHVGSMQCLLCLPAASLTTAGPAVVAVTRH